MLTRLSQAVSRKLISTIDLDEQCSASGHDRELVNLNVEELCQLVRPLPHLAWSTFSDVCTRTLTPVYSAISNALRDDVEQLAQLFVDLEASHERQAYYEVEVMLIERQDVDDPIVIHHHDPSLPTIIITPCPSAPRESACLVPYQDAAFGNKLPIPTHPALNDVYPPLVAKPFPLVENWRYEDGHWHAQLPPVQEQMSKGMFSRPLSTRRQRALDASRVQVRASRGRTCYSRRSHREG
ncbi:hypothetical protein BN946_scf185007.g204 [Trametes cinnabarina]|uniref:Uncharacterized protein n=1 Tax=Pycnoporus cinnabarinus TaxID=5643 RepID=A0A060SLN4_PYCCI|nr:hypothetical protein BN946_scf185007.g204 [Trametes cinnabarina]